MKAKEIGNILDLTERRVIQLSDECSGKKTRGDYDEKKIVQYYISLKVDEAKRKFEIDDYEEARLRKTNAEALKIERENEIAQGLLVEIEQIEKTWSAILSNFKNRLMKLPKRLISQTFGMDNEKKAVLKAEQLIDEALNELSNTE